MLTELKLNKKIFPVNFFVPLNAYNKYIVNKFLNVNYYDYLLNIDKNLNFANKPYKISLGHCYILQSKIQNWNNFVNVFWNQNYHFFFKRSYKTATSGCFFKKTNNNSNLIELSKIIYRIKRFRKTIE